MGDRQTIGRRVREAREEQRWTQQQLGARYGCSHAAISDLERGVTKIDVADLLRLADILDKDLAFFLGTPLDLPRREPDARLDRRRLKRDFVRHVRELLAQERQGRAGHA